MPFRFFRVFLEHFPAKGFKALSVVSYEMTLKLVPQITNPRRFLRKEVLSGLGASWVSSLVAGTKQRHQGQLHRKPRQRLGDEPCPYWRHYLHTVVGRSRHPSSNSREPCNSESEGR